MSNLTLSSFLLGSLLLAGAAPAFAQDFPRKPGAPVAKPAALAKKSPAMRKLDLGKLRSLKLGEMQATDLASPQFKSLSASEKLAVLAGLPNRFGKLNLTPVPKQTTGTSSNGVKYFMARTDPVLPKASTGTSSTERGKDDIVVCKTTPMSIAKEFAGPLMVVGLPSSQNQSVISPGALFRDSDVVRGVFTPLTLPRKPGSITLDVFNPGGPVAATVQNFNDRTQVTTAINTLRSGAASAESNAYVEYTEASFRASAQLNVEMEGSMEANLEALIGAPVSAGASAGGSLGFEQSVNVAVATLTHVAYTISVGGEGPASTVDGAVPSDALCVTDVQYGRRAFLLVGSLVSRSEASLTLSQLVSVGTGEADLVSASRDLSAEAKRALELGFVRVSVVGGSVQQAVQVRDLATLRNFIEQLNPSVGQINAVPLAYTLRYASDNAPAKTGAFAEIVDKECFHAKQVKVTLNSIKPTKVVDWGDEELFGHVKVVDSGNLASGERTLWKKSESNAVSGKEGVAINVGESGTFNFNAAVSSDDEVKVEIELNDRIMGGLDPEWAGAKQADRDRGYAKYERKTAKVSLADIAKGTNGKLTKKFAVEEGDARVEFSLSYELIGP